MKIDKDNFIKGIIKGEIKPSKVETKLDKKGQPLTIFYFPQFECQVHAHFTDEKREAIVPSHIVPYSRDPKDILPIDNYTLAMLRHHAEESGALSVPIERNPFFSKKDRKLLLLLIIGIFLVLLLTILFNKNETTYKTYITLKETLHIHDCTFVPGVKYKTDGPKPLSTATKYGIALIGYPVSCKKINGNVGIAVIHPEKIEQIFCWSTQNPEKDSSWKRIQVSQPDELLKQYYHEIPPLVLEELTRNCVDYLKNPKTMKP